MEKEQANKKELYTLAEWKLRSDAENRPAIIGRWASVDETTRMGPRVRIEGDMDYPGFNRLFIENSHIGAETSLLYDMFIERSIIGERVSIFNQIPNNTSIISSDIGDDVTIESAGILWYCTISSGCHITHSRMNNYSFIGVETKLVNSAIASRARVGANATIQESVIQTCAQLPDNIIVRGAWIRAGMIITEEYVIEFFINEKDLGRCFHVAHHPSIIKHYGLDEQWTYPDGRAETIVTPLCEHPISHFISFKHKSDMDWKKGISFSEKELRNYKCKKSCYFRSDFQWFF